MLEFWREEAFEIVLDDKDAEKIGVASSANYVPGKCGEAESDDGERMETTKSVSPAPAENRPEKYCAARENDCRRTFGKHGEA